MKKISTISILVLAVCAFCIVLMRSCGGAEKAPEPIYTAPPVTVQPTTPPTIEETPTPVVLTTPEPVEMDIWTTDNVNLRRYADSGSDVMTLIPKGTMIHRLYYPNGQWVRVRHEELEGYVCVDYVSNTAPVAEAPAQPTDSPAATATPVEESFAVDPCYDAVYTTDSVNLRRGPGTEYDVAGSVDKDTYLERTGTTANGWSRILYNSVGYFVNSDFVTTVPPVVEEPTAEPVGPVGPVGPVEPQPPSPTPTPTVTSGGSGQFSTDTGVTLNMFIDWTAAKTADGNFDLTVTASLLSGPLSATQFPDNLCFNIGGNTYYKTAPAIAIDAGMVTTPLGSQTVTVPPGNVTVSVSWSFQGTYSGKDIGYLTAGTNLYLQ